MRLACAALAFECESFRSTVTVVGLCDCVLLIDEVLMKLMGLVTGCELLLGVNGGVDRARFTVSF